MNDHRTAPATRARGIGMTRVPPDLKGRITLDKVVFRYRPEATPVLNNISLDIRPGEIIGIALLTDTDNTKSEARAFYGDIELIRKNQKDITK